MKQKKVNKGVTKKWARRTAEILTRSAQDIATISTHLLTVTTAEAETLKSASARERLTTGHTAILQAMQYGWAYGICAQQRVIERPTIHTRDRRLRVLIPAAIKVGEDIGLHQAHRARAAGECRQ